MKKLLVLAAVGLLATGASAATIFEETFDALNTAVIHGQGGWTSDKAGTAGEGAVVAPGLVFTGACPVDGDGKCLTQTLSGESVTHALPALADVDLYFRFLFKSKNAVGNAEVFLRLDSTNNWNTYLAVKNTGPIMEARIGGGAQPTVAIPEDGNVHLIVGRLRSDGFGNFIALDGWFDPAAGDVNSPDITAVGTAAVSTVDMAQFRHYNEQTWQDELKFATTWLEVIPEPATMVLLGIGGLGVLLRKRR